MSNVRINKAITQISQARDKVRALRQRSTKAPQATTQSSQSRTPGVAADRQIKSERSTPDRKGSVQARNNGRNSPVGSGRKHSGRGESSKMVSLNRAVSPSVKSILEPTKRDPNARLFKLDSHEEHAPLATASSLSKLPASFHGQTEQAVHTPYGPGIRYSGTEYLTTVSTIAGENVTRGNVLFAMPISPQVIPDTRLKLAAQMYTRFIFKKVRFYYSGTAPATTPGSLMMFGDYDPSQNPMASPGDGALRYAFTHSASDISVWQGASVEINDTVYNDMLYTDPDEELRWSIQGCFWLLSTGSLPAGTELGKLVMEYEIDFAVPDYRGVIENPTAGDYSFNLAATAIGNPLTVSSWVTTSPPTGVYFVRVRNVSGTILFNVSDNAYEQGVPPMTLQKGMCLWMVKSQNNGGTRFLWTPDLYSLASADVLGCVLGGTTGVSIQIDISVYAVSSVTND